MLTAGTSVQKMDVGPARERICGDQHTVWGVGKQILNDQLDFTRIKHGYQFTWFFNHLGPGEQHHIVPRPRV